jgi:CspA family cold shock protein
MVEGRVKWFDGTRGYGFLVAPDGGADILLHYNLLVRHGRKRLPEGARVTALVRDGPRGRQAVELVAVDLADAGMSASGGPGRVDPLEFLDAAGPFEPVEVRWFNRTRGYGFLLAADGQTQIFVHMETVRRGGLEMLEPGQKLLARSFAGPRGALAVAVAATPVQ